jgi:multiple sugar transport system substrate-binding protein
VRGAGPRRPHREGARALHQQAPGRDVQEDAPDLFQIDDNYLAEYATRNVTLDLTPCKDKGALDVSKFPESLWKYGVVDGRLAGVAFGENTQGLVYNETPLGKHRLPAPTTGMSWEDFVAWAEIVSRVTKTPGTQDPSAGYKAFWVWLRQRGKELGFIEQDVAGWLQLWMGARDRGATPAADERLPSPSTCWH